MANTLRTLPKKASSEWEVKDVALRDIKTSNVQLPLLMLGRTIKAVRKSPQHIQRMATEERTGNGSLRGGAIVIASVVSSVIVAGCSYGMTLIIEGSDIGEVGGDAEDCIESIGLNTGLWRSSCEGSSCGFGASVLIGLAAPTSVPNPVADETGDNDDVLSRTVGKGCCVPSQHLKKRTVRWWGGKP